MELPISCGRYGKYPMGLISLILSSAILPPATMAPFGEHPIRVWCRGCAAALGADEIGSNPITLTNRLWLSLVEQALRECEVEGSNPSSLTNGADGKWV